MQFTDAVVVAGTPPVKVFSLWVAKRLLARFARENGIPAPIEVDWIEDGDVVRFIGRHDGRDFAVEVQRG